MDQVFEKKIEALTEETIRLQLDELIDGNSPQNNGYAFSPIMSAPQEINSYRSFIKEGDQLKYEQFAKKWEKNEGLTYDASFGYQTA